MKRSKFSLSNYKLLSGDMGALLPVGLSEVLPGDTFQQHTSVLLRCSPLVAPVMHPVTVRVHHWFVPMRLLWTGWESFITGGSDGQGDGVGPIPTIGPVTLAIGDMPVYLGVPEGGSRTFNALPVRAYNMIFNEFYRDQDLKGEVTQDNLALQSACWEKDYFTSARPWPQKGPSVTLPLGTSAPVGAIEGGSFRAAETGLTGTIRRADNDQQYAANLNIFADLSQSTGAAITDIREAFALQRYKEARARYGSRYTEYLRYLGVAPADSRLQRPEYLGGGKQTISFSEVLQTAEGTNAVGTMRGHGVAALRSGRYRKFFQEHGYVMTLLTVRPKTMYIDGLERLWTRSIKEDFWQKELEHIGQQEILKKEIFLASTAADNDVWGYQDRYDEYRRQWSTIGGEFRTSVLNFWHMARDFTAAPTLNSSFVDCVPSKRNFAVQTNNVLWIMAYHKIAARRMVSKVGMSHVF